MIEYQTKISWHREAYLIPINVLDFLNTCLVFVNLFYNERPDIMQFILKYFFIIHLLRPTRKGLCVDPKFVLLHYNVDLSTRAHVETIQYSDVSSSVYSWLISGPVTPHFKAHSHLAYLMSIHSWSILRPMHS